MENVEKKVSTRVAIKKYLKENRRKLAYLSDITDIPYGTIYGIFIQQTMELSPERLEKINTALGTDFK